MSSFENALALHRQGQAEAAEAAYRSVLEAEPGHPDALNNLALLCKQRGAMQEAEEAYHDSLLSRPQAPEVLSNLGVLLLEQGRLKESETALQEAVKVRPDYVEAWNNLGNLLQGQRRYEEAEAAYREVMQRIPPRYEALIQQAKALPAEQGGRIEGLRRQALGVRSTLVEACWNQSLLCLLQGRYAEGWRLHETRYDPGRLRPVPLPPKLPMPMWRGEALAGKSILVWFEQGMGDEIQFARYLPWLKSQGAIRVTLVCKAPLQPLLATVAGVDEVLPAEGKLVFPPHDYWVMPMSLALYHQTRLETIPAALPYVSTLPERVAKWRDKLPKRGKRTTRVVGLVWAGSATHRNDAQRSLPSLANLAPLADVPGIAFVSLQKGEREDEAKQPPNGLSLMPLGGLIQDFADTAAIIESLDLVITVDTAVAHVAGALGKPCWVLLPWLGVDWRWLMDRDDSPWYPGVLRLFRQGKAGDWAGVVNEVVRALKKTQPKAAGAKVASSKGGKKGKR